MYYNMLKLSEEISLVSGMFGKKSTNLNPNIVDKATFLDAIYQLNPRIASRIEESVSGIEEPVFELWGKCAMNYNVGRVKIRNGKGGDVVGGGAISFKPDWDDGDFHKLKFSLNMPGNRSIRGYKDNFYGGGHLNLVNEYPGGRIVREEYNSFAELLHQSPMDTNIVKKVDDSGLIYLNREEIPVLKFKKDGVIEYMPDGSKICISSYNNGGDIRVNWTPHRGDGCHIYLDSDGTIEAEIANEAKPFKKRFPVMKMTLDNDLKIKSQYICNEFEVSDCVTNSEPRPIPDEILNQPGFKEILYRFNKIRQMKKEFPDSIDTWQFLEKFKERFYGSRIQQAK